MTDRWADRAFLRGIQYQTDANLAARQSIYHYQHPRLDLPARVIDLAAPAVADTIVDVGCGNGAYLAELVRRGLGTRVLGLDLSLGMLAAARLRLSETDPRPALAGGDAAALPLCDGAASLVLAPHMLYHVPEPADALRELRRVTRPGGRVVIVLNGAGHLRQLRAAVAAAGGGDPAVPAERIRLDDGEVLARSFFTHVTRHDFTAELRVPAPGPIADYIRSMTGTQAAAAADDADPDRIADTAAHALPKDPDNNYVITSHSGCLIARVG
ncbi:MAG TPA: class I SAM-dependent methyltransferase [Trebonia sp.]